MVLNEIQRLHRDETGAGYSISLMLIIPLYIAYIAFAIECILLINSSLALTAAVQTAGHTVKAWALHREELQHGGEELPDVVRQCVARNMLPFVTTKAVDRSESDNDLFTALQASGMTRTACERYASKFAFIKRSIRVQIEPQARETQGMLVKIEYDSPLWTQALAPWLSTSRGPAGAVHTLNAQTWIPLADVEYDLTSMGIPFSPKHAKNWSE